MTRTYLTKKGKHLGRPSGSIYPWFTLCPLRKSVVAFTISLEDSAYTYPIPSGGESDDQYDWNKLCGINLTPWLPHTNAAMIGWRQRRSGQYELTPYYNIKGETRRSGQHWPVSALDSISDVKCVFEYTPTQVIIRASRGSDWLFTHTLDHDGAWEKYWFMFPIVGWHGGTRPWPMDQPLITRFDFDQLP